MSVYVDPLCANGWILRGRAVMNSHLWSDSETELHDFAKRIDMKRSWHKMSNSGLSHYDLTPWRRKHAVRFGAVELNRKESVAQWRKKRA